MRVIIFHFSFDVSSGEHFWKRETKASHSACRGSVASRSMAVSLCHFREIKWLNNQTQISGKQNVLHEICVCLYKRIGNYFFRFGV